MVQKWMLGESYQAYGRLSVCGMLAAEQDLQPDAPMAEIRERHDGAAADAQHVFQHHARLPRRLQRLRQDHVVEGIVGIIRQVGVGVALDHRESLGDALVDALARKLDAAAVDIARLGEQTQQFAVAAADVEHLARRARPSSATTSKVDARAARRRAPHPPW